MTICHRWASSIDCTNGRFDLSIRAWAADPGRSRSTASRREPSLFATFGDLRDGDAAGEIPNAVATVAR